VLTPFDLAIPLPTRCPYLNPDLVSNPVTEDKPPDASPNGAVIISYTAPSASPLSKLQCAGQPATMVVKGPVLVNGTTKGDVIVGDPGANQINGTNGNDTICSGNEQGDGASDQIAGGQGNDRLYGQAGNDSISGGPGNDTISGGPGDDVIAGGPGNDRITPGPGRDRVNAGAGNDRIYSRDGQRDVINCGPGHDVAIIDAIDRTRNCETVIRPHPPRRHPTPPTSRR
jgi:RTX calcium-binding nonapeptide repeat (4 copies)